MDKEWIPTGVWRFREIAKEALKQVPLKFETLEQAFIQVKKMLDYPLEKIMDRSNTLRIIKSQRTLEDFFPKDIHG